MEDYETFQICRSSKVYVNGNAHSANLCRPADFFGIDRMSNHVFVYCRCKLHFTNWAYNGLQMNLTVLKPDISLDNYQVNGEWDIVATTANR